MLTGLPPLPALGTELRQLYDIFHTVPKSAMEVNAQVPRDLATICAKALEKDPADRFASAAALAVELQAFLEDKPLRIRPPTQWDRLRRWQRRNPVAARVALGMGVLVVSVGIGLVAWDQHNKAVLAKAGWSGNTARGVPIACVHGTALHLLTWVRYATHTPVSRRC